MLLYFCSTHSPDLSSLFCQLSIGYAISTSSVLHGEPYYIPFLPLPYISRDIFSFILHCINPFLTTSPFSTFFPLLLPFRSPFTSYVSIQLCKYAGFLIFRFVNMHFGCFSSFSHLSILASPLFFIPSIHLGPLNAKWQKGNARIGASLCITRESCADMYKAKCLYATDKKPLTANTFPGVLTSDLCRRRLASCIAKSAQVTKLAF